MESIISPLQDAVSSLRWENPKKMRYYQIYISRDLFGDWVITKAWGSLNTAAGRVVHTACPSLDQAYLLIEKISRMRIKHGYVSKAIVSSS